MIKFDKLFKLTFSSLLVLELFSYLGYLHPIINTGVFFILVISCIFLSIKKLEYGVWLVLAELFVGSKGYLFYFNFHNFSLSIRIALWLVVMAVWFGKILIDITKTKNLKLTFRNYLENFKTGNNKYFVLLFVLILWGGLNGWLNHNQPSFVIDELKRWSYLLFIFPLATVLKTKSDGERLLSVFWASTIWLSFKTIILLFIFSHSMLYLVYPVYRWVRTTGVGEITQIQGGFYRIFIQSQIFNLAGFFMAAYFLIKEILENKFNSIFKNKIFLTNYFLATFFLIVILLCFSRSFWVGMAAGFFILTIAIIYLTKKYYLGSIKMIINNLLKSAAIFFSIFILSLLLIIIFVKFPYPRPVGGFNATDLFSERATATDESAIGSRWALLPKLWSKISEAPIEGKGFGTTVTYSSQDPRVLQINPGGEYTTYAFEWGWLDIWLKLGIIGLLSYLWLLAKISFDAFKNNFNRESAFFGLSLITGLVVLVVVNFFTPYLNHPLGLGFLMITYLLTIAEPTTIAEN